MTSLPSSASHPRTSSGVETRWVAQAWLGSRLLVLAFAIVLAARQGAGLGDVANHWDAELYGRIAVQGYLPEPNLMAFFPGLPLLMRAGLVLGVPTVLTGVVVATVSSAIAAAALVRLGGRHGHWVAIAWLFAPTAVFTAVPYTEAPFCAAAFWAWERARARDWRSAAILAGIAASFRVSGLFLIAALAVLALTQSSARGTTPLNPRYLPISSGLARRLLNLVWLGIPVGVVVAYLGYLYAVTGDPLAWYHAQQAGWMRSFTWPWQAAINTWDVARPGGYPDHPLWSPVFRFEIVSMVLGLITTGWCLGRRRWAEATWVGLQVLAFSISYWFYSVNRATLLWFPLWVMLVELAVLRPRRAAARMAHRTVVVVAAAGTGVTMLWWCWLFFTGNWAS